MPSLFLSSWMRDAPGRIELAGGIEILHVAAQLDDEHSAVAVERDLTGLLDVGLRDDGLNAIALWQDEARSLLGRREREHWAAEREVGATSWAAGAAPAAAATLWPDSHRRSPLRRARCGCLLLGKRRKAGEECQRRETNDEAEPVGRTHVMPPEQCARMADEPENSAMLASSRSTTTLLVHG